jgi:gas vesicle protein
MSSSSSLEKFLVGTLLGGAVGALLGLLLAPQAGEETRKKLREEAETKGKKSWEVASETLDKSSTVVKEKYQTSLETLKDTASWLKNCAEELGKDLDDLGKKTVENFKKPVKGEQNGSTSSNEPLVAALEGGQEDNQDSHPSSY